MRECKRRLHRVTQGYVRKRAVDGVGSDTVTHHSRKSPTDDQCDGEIDHVPSQDEILELCNNAVRRVVRLVLDVANFFTVTTARPESSGVSSWHLPLRQLPQQLKILTISFYRI